MLATLFAAAITCAAALVLGQGVLWVCGRRTWSWLAGPLGLSVLMLLAVPALHVPGRATTCAIVILVAVGASLALMVREPAVRPPLAGLAAGIWPALLTVVPFAVAGRSGTLGVSISNDMSAHLLLADAHINEALTPLVGPNYPLGPHAFVAAIAGPLPIATDHAFAGFTMALPVLLGWTALAALRDVGWLGQAVVATLVGMPFLIAAYFGQGAFKEILLAAQVMAIAVLLAAQARERGPLRWVPAALLVAGTISVYSYTGLVWPGLFFGAWLAGLLVEAGWRHGGLPRGIGGAVRAELAPIALGVAVLVVVLIPQLPRVYRYLQGTGGGTGLADTALGNLVGPLPFWEGFGHWDNADFRFPAHDPLATGVWVGAILVLVVLAFAWWLRRGAWMVPAATLLCAGVWWLTDRTQSPYVAAKALVILSPFLMLLISRPLVERRSWIAPPAWLRFAAPAVAVLLLWAVTGSSWDALRQSQVGPRDHLAQLRDLRTDLGGASTLFLGNDDFIRWELEGVPVLAPFIGAPGVETRPEKAWQYGQAFDVDSVPADVYAQVSYVITTRDPAGSQPPPQLRLVRTTRDFALYRRVGTYPQRGLLPEGEAPGAVLDCRKDPKMRALSRQPGTAAVRGGGVAIPGPSVLPGKAVTVGLKLPAGRWDIVMAYTSPLGIEVSAPGLRTTKLVANLDRPGPRFGVGTVSVGQATTLPLRVSVPGHPLSSTAAPAIVTSIIAVPPGRDRTIPLRRACGQLVDYFNPQAA